MFWTYNCVWWFAPPWLLLLLDARCVHGPLHSEFSGASTTIAVQRASLNASFHLRARPSFRRRRTTCARDAAARSVVARHTRTHTKKSLKSLTRRSAHMLPAFIICIKGASGGGAWREDPFTSERVLKWLKRTFFDRLKWKWCRNCEK